MRVSRGRGQPYAAPHPGQVECRARRRTALRPRRVAFGDSEVSPPPSGVQPPGCRSQGGDGLHHSALPVLRANTVNRTCRLRRPGVPVNAQWRGVLGAARRAAAGDQLLLGRGMPEGGRVKPATCSLPRPSGHATSEKPADASVAPITGESATYRGTNPAPELRAPNRRYVAVRPATTTAWSLPAVMPLS